MYHIKLDMILPRRFFALRDYSSIHNGQKLDKGIIPRRERAEVIAETKVYQLAMNPVYQFVVDECAVGCDANGLPFEVEANSLWDVYSDARSHYDMRTVKSAISLGKYLKAFGFEPFRETTGIKERKWRYIRLLDHETMPVQPGQFRCRWPDGHIKGSITGTSYMIGDIGKVCDFCAFIRPCGPNTEPDTIPVPQAELVEDIVQILNGFKKGRSAPIDLTTDEVAAAVDVQIKADKPELRDYDVESFYKKLVETDQEVQALTADCARGKH